MRKPLDGLRISVMRDWHTHLPDRILSSISIARCQGSDESSRRASGTRPGQWGQLPNGGRAKKIEGVFWKFFEKHAARGASVSS